MHDLICIGVDQSYKRTGVSMSVDGTLLRVKSIDLAKFTKHKSRMLVSDEVKRATYAALNAADHVIVILERIRMFSQQFVSMPYILSMGMMNGAVYDSLASQFQHEIESSKLEVATVETRAWKRAVVGTTKGAPNDYGVPDNKWPTIEWLLSNYPGFEPSIMHKSKSKMKTKSNFEIDGTLYEYDDDAADSACMSLFPFMCPDYPSKLILLD